MPIQAGFLFGGDAYRCCQCPAVSTNHFDIDSFLSVWAYCNRPLALAHESGERPGSACSVRDTLKATMDCTGALIRGELAEAGVLVHDLASRCLVDPRSCLANA